MSKPLLICQDYTVTNELFELHYNETYDMLVTQPKPKETELPKYYESQSYISHSNTNKTIIDRIYQLIRGYTLKKKLRLLNSFNSADKTLLDVGAGTGDFLKTCKKGGWNITGVEPNETARNLAMFQSDITVVAKITSLKDQKFDVITMWHVLEHVYDLENYIEKLKNLLKPNGVLLVAVPNYKSHDAQFYGVHWAAYDVPRHLWHFSRKSIKLLFGNIDMKITKTLPMYFDSFYVSLLSEKYKNGRTNFLKAFYVGLRSNMKAKRNNEYSSLIYLIKTENKPF